MLVSKRGSYSRSRWVRFPLLLPKTTMPDDASRLLVTASKACGTARYGGRHFRLAPDARITQQVECVRGKDEVVSSSLAVSSRYALIAQPGRVPDGRGHYVNPLK